MKKYLKKDNEFYIGYLPEAPKNTARIIRLVIFSLGAILILVNVLLVLNQKPFSTSDFEYGIETELTGQLFYDPIPHLRIFDGVNAEGDSIYQTVLLVGFGKYGARQTTEFWEQSLTQSLDSKIISVEGSLIYGNGKTLLQITEDQLPVNIVETSESAVLSFAAGQNKFFDGEIVDPKCYFGVMKPGEGKAHRSCAIRCISGGIPPVLRSGSEYYILTDENLQPVNAEVLSFVGEQITLEGEVLTLDDWKILKVKRNDLQNLAKEYNTNTITLDQNMSVCGL